MHPAPSRNCGWSCSPSRINVSFPPVIHLITNDDWRNMVQCSIIDLSPPTPPRIGFNPPSVGGFFFDKISASWQRSTEYTSSRHKWTVSRPRPCACSSSIFQRAIQLSAAGLPRWLMRSAVVRRRPANGGPVRSSMLADALRPSGSRRDDIPYLCRDRADGPDDVLPAVSDVVFGIGG